MGKIHKALQKSKLDRQRQIKPTLVSPDYRPKNRRETEELLNKKHREKIAPDNDNSKLGMIHYVLGDNSEINTFESEKTIAKEQGSVPEHIEGDILSNGKKIDGEKSNTVINRNKDTEKETFNGVVPGTEVERRKNLVQQGIDDMPLMFTRKGHKLSEPTQLTNIHYSLITLTNPRSFEAERFKILRTNLLFPESGKLSKTILITSAAPGEGKTFTAMNLAISLAQSLNSYVLLVDADIRKPEVHKRFGFKESVEGLSDFLSENIPIQSLLLKTQIPNLSILPGGKAASNPSELISSEKMKRLINELAARYSDRFIVIDAAPPKLASETCALAHFVDQIIAVVRSGRTDRNMVEETLNLVGRDKVKGVILNCYDIRGAKYSNYKQYGKYYSK
jgi:exopolysaccharide/PEP-CTERM locus tyrosine autokinase